MEELNNIAQLVIDETGVNITNKKRDHQTVIHRWIYFKLAADHTSYSLGKIGAAVGRDHATVIHGLKQFEIEIQWDKQLQAKHEKLSIICARKLNGKDIHTINNQIDFLHNELAKLHFIKNELLNEPINTEQ